MFRMTRVVSEDDWPFTKRRNTKRVSLDGETLIPIIRYLSFQ